jgi:hypothetical protein
MCACVRVCVGHGAPCSCFDSPGAGGPSVPPVKLRGAVALPRVTPAGEVDGLYRDRRPAPSLLSSPTTPLRDGGALPGLDGDFALPSPATPTLPPLPPALRGGPSTGGGGGGGEDTDLGASGALTAFQRQAGAALRLVYVLTPLLSTPPTLLPPLVPTCPPCTGAGDAGSRGPDPAGVDPLGEHGRFNPAELRLCLLRMCLEDMRNSGFGDRSGAPSLPGAGEGWDGSGGAGWGGSRRSLRVISPPTSPSLRPGVLGSPLQGVAGPMSSAPSGVDVTGDVRLVREGGVRACCRQLWPWPWSPVVPVHVSRSLFLSFSLSLFLSFLSVSVSVS